MLDIMSKILSTAIKTKIDKLTNIHARALKVRYISLKQYTKDDNFAFY